MEEEEEELSRLPFSNQQGCWETTTQAQTQLPQVDGSLTATTWNMTARGLRLLSRYTIKLV